MAPVASFAALLLAAAALYGLRGVSPRQRVMGFPYARRLAFLSEVDILPALKVRGFLAQSAAIPAQGGSVCFVGDMCALSRTAGSWARLLRACRSTVRP